MLSSFYLSPSLSISVCHRTMVVREWACICTLFVFTVNLVGEGGGIVIIHIERKYGLYSEIITGMIEESRAKNLHLPHVHTQNSISISSQNHPWSEIFSCTLRFLNHDHHPSSIPLIYQGHVGKLEPIPAGFGKEAGYSQSRSPIDQSQG